MNAKIKKIVQRLAVVLAIPLVAAGCSALAPFGLGTSGTFGIAKTVDGGNTWQPADVVSASSSISGAEINAMQIAPSNHTTVYAGGLGGLWVSTDSAATWKSILTSFSVDDVYLSAANVNTIVAAGYYGSHGKIVVSTDAGKTWTETYNDASPQSQVTGITASSANPLQMFASLDSGTVIASTDGGVTWASIAQNTGDVGLGIRMSPLNGELYLMLQRKGLVASTDAGRTWNSIVGQLTANAFSFSTVTSISSQPVSIFYRFALDQTTAGSVYLATANGLYRTSNNGASWTYVAIPTSNVGNVFPYVVAGTDAGMVAYTSIARTMYKTLDGGATWQTQELPAGAVQVGAIAIDPTLPQITYVALTASAANSY